MAYKIIGDSCTDLSKELRDENFVSLVPLTLMIKNENFVDDAQFMVRFNEKLPKSVKGGELTHLTGDLYLLEANKSAVTVHFK